MKPTTNSPLFTDALSKGYETRAIMVKYIRRELDHHTAQKVAALINNCEDCRKLHKEVKAFISDTVDPDFVEKNKVILQDNDRFLDTLVAKHTNRNEYQSLKTPRRRSDDTSNFDIDDHLCCGS